MAKKKELKVIETAAVVEPPRTSTDAEIELRIAEIESLLIQGYTRSELLRHTSKWQVSSRTVDTYQALALERIQEVNKLTLKQNQGIMTKALWKLFRQAMERFEDGPIILTDSERNQTGAIDHRPKYLAEANKVLAQLCKIKGVDQITVNHIIEDKRELQAMSDEDLEMIIEGEVLQ